MQFLDLDLDLNELGGDISWSPASHTLLQDTDEEKNWGCNQVLRFKTCFLFGMVLFQPLDLGEDVMIPGLRRWVVKNPPK